MVMDVDRACKSLLRLSVRNNKLGLDASQTRNNRLCMEASQTKNDTKGDKLRHGYFDRRAAKFKEKQDIGLTWSKTDSKFRFDLVPHLQVLHAEYNPNLKLAEIVAGFTGPSINQQGNLSSSVSATTRLSHYKDNSPGKKMAGGAHDWHGRNKANADLFLDKCHCSSIETPAARTQSNKNKLVRSQSLKTGLERSGHEYSGLEKLLRASKMSSLRQLSIHVSCEEDLILSRLDAEAVGAKFGETGFSEGTNILTFFNEIEELKFFAWSKIPTSSGFIEIDQHHNVISRHFENRKETDNYANYSLLGYTFQLSTYFLNLKSLDLSGQGITKLAPRFAEFVPNLRVANFAFNKLGDEDLVTVFCKIPRLARLFLYGNKIENVESVIRFLQYLPAGRATSVPLPTFSAATPLRSDSGRAGAGRTEETGIETKALQILDLRNNPVTEGFYPDVIQVQRSQEELSHKERFQNGENGTSGTVSSEAYSSMVGNKRDGSKGDGRNKVILLCDVLQALQMPADSPKLGIKKGPGVVRKRKTSSNSSNWEECCENGRDDLSKGLTDGRKFRRKQLISVTKSLATIYQDALKKRGQEAWRATDIAYIEQQLVNELSKYETDQQWSNRVQDERIRYWAAVLISCPGLKWLDGHTLTEPVCKSIMRVWREM